MEEEDEETMKKTQVATKKKSASKSPVRKKAPAPAPAPAPAANAGIEEQMEAMSLSNGSRYNTNSFYPYMLYPHMVNQRCQVDFFFCANSSPIVLYS